MRKTIILIAGVLLAPSLALAQQMPVDQAKAALAESYQVLRYQIGILGEKAEAFAKENDQLRVNLAKAKADAEYWQSACDKTPECSGKPH